MLIHAHSCQTRLSWTFTVFGQCRPCFRLLVWQIGIRVQLVSCAMRLSLTTHAVWTLTPLHLAHGLLHIKCAPLTFCPCNLALSSFKWLLLGISRLIRSLPLRDNRQEQIASTWGWKLELLLIRSRRVWYFPDARSLACCRYAPSAWAHVQSMLVWTVHHCDVFILAQGSLVVLTSPVNIDRVEFHSWFVEPSFVFRPLTRTENLISLFLI